MRLCAQRATPYRPSSKVELPTKKRKVFIAKSSILDRCGSAWLIRQFIDPKATFRFASQKPERSNAVSFDMLEADFTNDGDLCTFETLCLRFAIKDPIVSQIAGDGS